MSADDLRLVREALSYPRPLDNRPALAALDRLEAHITELQAESKRIIKDAGVVITRVRKRAEVAEANEQELRRRLLPIAQGWRTTEPGRLVDAALAAMEEGERT